MVAENAGQSALMAPTEILARQHYENLSEPAAAAGLSIALLTSGTSIPDRHELVPRVLTGEIDLVIGTHALLSSTLRFPRLRLAVIDEQHRFGVVQRARLADTDLLPHVLVMSATPIPRSLAMTVFGDLDVSVIREKPPGRLTTETQWLIDADAAYGLLKQKLETGDRAFVVCPLVDESASVASAAAVPVFKELSRTRLRGFRLGLVHGRMTEMEKHAALTSFAAGETQVLVASSIVEVGVDVPEAGVMLVDGAERFGLSQLHQLRGRVGRSSRRGLCLLLTGADIGPKAEHRMRALVTGDDGFKIAEEDLAIRGPGDILGTRQHGLPALRWASLARDIELVEEARAAAKKLLERDPDLSAHPKAARLLAYRWGKLLELGNIG
ncbi:MAG: helicase-related protein [Deltaproteobacteria bacterium]|nr:helicase-related protein [Deltaproteobacteria bacterium]